MREYTFVRGDGDKKVIEARSLKKAMRSFQTKAGDAKVVYVEWKSRKGNVSFYTYNLPYKFRKERKGR